MAYRATGRALAGIGQMLPGLISRSISEKKDEELDPLREALLRSQVDTAGIEAQKAKTEQQRSMEAQARLEEALKLINEPGYEEMPEDFEGPPTPKAKPSVEEALFRSGAAKYMDKPDVAGVAKLAESAKPKLTQRSPYAIAAQEDIDRAHQWIDAEIAAGNIEPGSSEEIQARVMADREPIRMMANTSRKSFITDENLRQYKETTPLAAERAGRTATATTEAAVGATKLLPPKDRDFLTNTRSAYDDIATARNLFSESFAKPYIGKVMKVSQMKQLSPEFSAFISALESGIGKYRKEQFGAAQTGTELQNLKDRIDKDMSVSPKVLIAQIDNFLKTTQRDYSDRVNLLKSTKYAVPEEFAKVSISGGRAEETAGARTVFSSVQELEEYAQQHPEEFSAEKEVVIGGRKATWSP